MKYEIFDMRKVITFHRVSARDLESLNSVLAKDLKRQDVSRIDTF